MPSAFGEWNRRMVGNDGIRLHKESAAMIETPVFHYNIFIAIQSAPVFAQGEELKHGASPDRKFKHIAIDPNLDRGGVVWLEPVTDEEYNSIG